jgi:hypothetical protein
MLRLASFAVSLGLVVQVQAQVPGPGIQGNGIPASVTSPTADGRLHGVPASVVSPKPPIQGSQPIHHFGVAHRRPLRPFGDERRRHILVPVPIFYPAYGQTLDAERTVADPGVVDANEEDPVTSDEDRPLTPDEESMRRAYLQGAKDALTREANRYGRHYNSREDSRTATKVTPSSKDAETPVADEPQRPDDSPSTVFIFKDGRQLETKNFAIMGKTLYDFSSSGLKKVELSDLDTSATQKANDDRGITVKLP